MLNTWMLIGFTLHHIMFTEAHGDSSSPSQVWGKRELIVVDMVLGK
jgi:hypothetical protein